MDDFEPYEEAAGWARGVDEAINAIERLLHEGQAVIGLCESALISVRLLVKAATMMKRLNRSEEFVRQLEALRVKYKMRRSFIKLLEQRRKSLYLQTFGSGENQAEPELKTSVRLAPGKMQTLPTV